jgi:hypothetical protein
VPTALSGAGGVVGVLGPVALPAPGPNSAPHTLLAAAKGGEPSTRRGRRSACLCKLCHVVCKPCVSGGGCRHAPQAARHVGACDVRHVLTLRHARLVAPLRPRAVQLEDVSRPAHALRGVSANLDQSRCVQWVACVREAPRLAMHGRLGIRQPVCQVALRGRAYLEAAPAHRARAKAAARRRGGARAGEGHERELLDGLLDGGAQAAELLDACAAKQPGERGGRRPRATAALGSSQPNGTATGCGGAEIEGWDVGGHPPR